MNPETGNPYGTNAVGTVLLPSVPTSLDGTTGTPADATGSTSIYNAMASMNANTLASVGNILGGLPSVTGMASGAYGFLQQTIGGAQSAQAATIANENTFVTGNVQTVTPILASLARLVGRNQAAAIQAASNAGSNTGGGGSKL